MTQPLTHALHRAGRIKQIIERELRGRQSSPVRLMRLNTLLLKVQLRLVALLETGQPRLQPAAVLGNRHAKR